MWSTSSETAEGLTDLLPGGGLVSSASVARVDTFKGAAIFLPFGGIRFGGVVVVVVGGGGGSGGGEGHKFGHGRFSFSFLHLVCQGRWLVGGKWDWNGTSNFGGNGGTQTRRKIIFHGGG